ncbi:hypothetical protein [Thalassomonas sp. M1454]|uniref:hypothetical protein n=1 Tax=Thalassomonas sp. M1454 TaxID=2594477 RepID=UPI0011812895|nr:hypothetical protein [Thalassomonas sp. M1454]TRX56836.1 hypothetical protein FNN08_04770 [Thalassomonas sp. M1454]
MRKLYIGGLILLGIIFIGFEQIIIGGLLVIGSVSFVLFKQMFFTKHKPPLTIGVLEALAVVEHFKHTRCLKRDF